MARRRGKRHRTVRRLPRWRLALPFAAGTALAALLVVAWVAGPGWLAPPHHGFEPRTATVVTDVLNVRANPGTDAPILGGMVDGTSVDVIGNEENGYVPIRYGEGYGWIAVTYLSFGGDTVSSEFAPVQDVAAAELPGQPVEESVGVLAPEPTAAPPAEPAVPDAAPAEPAERWIDIDRSLATVTLYEGETAIASFQGKIGRDPAVDGFYSTAVGTYHVYSMNKGLSPTPFAEDTWLTDWVGFDPVRKNGIHSPVRDRDGNVKPWQNATTLGCVRLEAAAAETVFAFAEIGMRVEVHE